MTGNLQPEAPDEDSVTPEPINIALRAIEDLNAVRVFLGVIQDDPEVSRDIARRMSPRDRAVLAFYLREAGRIVEEETEFRETQDRRDARVTFQDASSSEW